MTGLKITLLGGLRIRKIENADAGRYTENTEADDRELIVSRNAAPRFLQLAELVWLRGEEGISREELLRSLYEGRELKSSANSLNNLLYQLRGKMQEAGLPGAQYIVCRGKRYYPDPEIPIEVDTARFKGLIEQARAALQGQTREGPFPAVQSRPDSMQSDADTLRDAQERDEGYNCGESGAGMKPGSGNHGTDFSDSCLHAAEATHTDFAHIAAALYAEAASIYRGPLLPELGDKSWAELERVRLAALYREACAGGMQDARWRVDPEPARSSREQAFPPYPDREHETFPKEADGQANRILPGEDEKKAAEGLQPFWNESDDGFLLSDDGAEQALRALLEQTGMRTRSGAEAHGKDARDAAAYHCSPEGFADICRAMVSLRERVVYPLHLMLLTMVDYRGRAIRNEEKLARRSALLEECVAGSLRQGDVYTGLSPSQVLVLMLGYDEQGRRRVMRRVRKGMREACGTSVKILWSETPVTDAE